MKIPDHVLKKYAQQIRIGPTRLTLYPYAEITLHSGVE